MQPLVEKTKFWHDQALGDLELLHATYVTHAFVPHMHEGYAIGVIERGAETFAYRRATHVAGAGSLVVVQPGELHTGQAMTAVGWSYRMLYPAAAQLQAAASTLADAPRGYPFFGAPVIQDAPLAQQCIQLHRDLEAGLSVLEREARWLAFLTNLITRHADAPRAALPAKASPSHLQMIVDYLEANYATNVTLAELTQLVHLSPYHLLRSFKAALGLPPHAYLNQLRVERAKRLLLAGLPIVEVALAVGFTDQSHLTRAFKRIVGVPPGQYTKHVDTESIATGAF
ncbi:MAG: AraC family transcriptional regulator [Caldilineaceae bacterium]|nr:AraC family transcriptional regulator [Caldilineaceae bacterium]